MATKHQNTTRLEAPTEEGKTEKPNGTATRGGGECSEAATAGGGVTRATKNGTSKTQSPKTPLAERGNPLGVWTCAGSGEREHSRRGESMPFGRSQRHGGEK